MTRKIRLAAPMCSPCGWMCPPGRRLDGEAGGRAAEPTGPAPVYLPPWIERGAASGGDLDQALEGLLQAQVLVGGQGRQPASGRPLDEALPQEVGLVDVLDRL